MTSPAFPRQESYQSTLPEENTMAEPSRTSTILPDPPTTSGAPMSHARPTGNFWDKTSEMAAARKQYLQMAVFGVIMLSLIIFGVLPLYWGALWKSPKPLSGWIVDFDGSTIGSQVSHALQSAPVSTIRWQVVDASTFPGGPSDLAHALKEEKAWAAISINPNATQRLQAAVASADSSYNGSLAITAYGVEARQETAYRSFVRPNFQTAIPLITTNFATQFSKQLASSSNFSSIANAAPQLLVSPIGYTIDNLIPFDIPVATAVTFVGLIYLLILTFFLLNVMAQARLLTGLENKLSLAGLLRLRIGTAFIQYFFVSLFYTLLSRAFQLDTTRKFGSGGLPLLWAVNFCGMLALGLALESMLTLLTIRFVGFFLIPWVVVNVSVAVLPIPVQNDLYRYGYAIPFYNVSRAVRTIVFGTKNELGLNFGILIAWAVLSICTISLFQMMAFRRAEKARLSAASPAAQEKQKEEA